MAVIKQDVVGIYVVANGWIGRPTKPTGFTVGTKLEAKHFGGSSVIGVGRLPGRNKWSEFWRTDILAKDMLVP